jgi:hypothetical protein
MAHGRFRVSHNPSRNGRIMAKSTERKTKVNTASVDDFIDAQPSEQVRDDCRTLVSLIEEATGARAEMWAPASSGSAATSGARQAASRSNG